jgi:hypothetical protein
MAGILIILFRIKNRKEIKMSFSVVEARYTLQEGGWSRQEWAQSLRRGLTPYGKEIKKALAKENGRIEFFHDCVAFYEIDGSATMVIEDHEEIIIRAVPSQQDAAFKIVTQGAEIQVHLGSQEFLYVIKVIDREKNISQAVVISTVSLSMLQ